MWKAGGGAPAGAPVEEDAAAAVHELLVQLDSLLKSARKNFKQIIKVCDQVLAISSKDPDALSCKIAALINSDNIPEALSLIEASKDVDVDFSFQKAYCLYRLNRYPEVLDLLKGIENTPTLLQLKAQTFFKTGDIASCIEAYEDLHQKFGIDSNEVRSNAVAAYVAGGKSDAASERMVSMQVNPKTLFELAYNTACVLIDRGELSEAEDHLLLARRLGQETFLEDEYTEEEIEDELAPVTAQLAYVQQVQGRTSEALESLLSVLKRDLKDKDLATVAVVSNNLAALRKNKDASDSLRKLEVLLKKDADGKRLVFAEALQQKFSVSQKEAMVYNYFLLLLSTNKLNQARELMPSIMDEYKGSSVPILLKACLSLKEGKLENAEQVLGDYAEKNSETATEALLLCAQARTAAGHYTEAANVLQKITDVKHMPSLVATVVDLKERDGDTKGAENALIDAVQWWENSMEERADILQLLVQQAANLKLKNKDLKGAAEFYDRLTNSALEKVRLEAITGLVCCYAEADAAKAESLEEQLPALEVVDAGKLEQSSVIPDVVVSGAEAGKQVVADQTAAVAEEKKKKRKRKPRYPKGYDPENPGPPPDPERWLPMRERSYYRPKKKDKRTAQLRGSQGSISRDSSTASTTTSTSAAAAAAASNGPSTSKPPAVGKNKKKGRR